MPNKQDSFYSVSNIPSSNESKTTSKNESTEGEENKTEKILEISYFDEDNVEPKYVSMIRKNRILMKKTYLDIKPSWEMMKIPSISKMQMEMRLHSDRIKALFEQLQQDIRTVGALRHLMKNNGEVIKKLLCSPDTEYIVHKLYKPSMKSSTTILAAGNKINEQLINICLHLRRNERLIEFVKLSGDKIISRPALDFCDELDNLFNSLGAQLLKTPNAQVRRNKNLRKSLITWREKEHIITSLAQRIKYELNTFHIKMKSRNSDITALKHKLESFLEKNSKAVTVKMKINESDMTHELLDSEFRQEEFLILAKEAVERYENLLAVHMTKERSMRARRFKIESQLINWLVKYDSIMTTKQDELDELTDGLERERGEFTELQCLYNEQKRLFNRYREQKNKEDYDELLLKVRMFTENRAARLLQRHWRDYWQRKMLKKALKKERAKARALKKEKGKK